MNGTRKHFTSTARPHTKHENNPLRGRLNVNYLKIKTLPAQKHGQPTVIKRRFLTNRRFGRRTKKDKATTNPSWRPPVPISSSATRRPGTVRLYGCPLGWPVPWSPGTAHPCSTPTPGCQPATSCSLAAEETKQMGFKLSHTHLIAGNLELSACKSLWITTWIYELLIAINLTLIINNKLF